MFPVWVIQLFTTAKSFKRNPIIGSRLLNRLGLHLVRIIVSSWGFRVLLWILAPLGSKADREDFLKNGIILKRDFLPKVEFEKLRDEMRAYDGDRREQIEGSTRTHRVYIDSPLLRKQRLRTFLRQEPID